MRFLVGLGNPGSEYQWNRHNIGYLFLDYLNKNIKFKKGKGPYKTARVTFENESVSLIKPTTFMNNSDLCIRRLISQEAILSHDWAVVYDDVNLDFGILRLRVKGSSGGHKGIDSVIEATGTDDFYRLRMGIGPAPYDEDLTSFVLGDFTEKEKEFLPDFLSRVREAFRTLLFHGIEKTQNVITNLNMDFKRSIHFQ